MKKSYIAPKMLSFGVADTEIICASTYFDVTGAPITTMGAKGNGVSDIVDIEETSGLDFDFEGLDFSIDE